MRAQTQILCGLENKLFGHATAFREVFQRNYAVQEYVFLYGRTRKAGKLGEVGQPFSRLCTPI